MKPQPSLTLFSHLWLISQEAEELFCLAGWLSPVCPLPWGRPSQRSQGMPKVTDSCCLCTSSSEAALGCHLDSGSGLQGPRGKTNPLDLPITWTVTLYNRLRSWLLTRGRMASSTASAHFGPNWPELESSFSTHLLCSLGHVASPLSTTTFSSLPQD